MNTSSRRTRLSKLRVVAGVGVLALGFGALKWSLYERDLRPRPIYQPKQFSIDHVQTLPDGDIEVGSEGYKPKPVFVITRLAPNGQMRSQSRVTQGQWRVFIGQSALSRDGWRVVLPPSDDFAGDHIFGVGATDNGAASNNGDRDTSLNYSISYLRLISPQGQVRVLKELPMFRQIRELRFSPDGSEVLALGANWLWRSNITTKRTLRVVRPGGGPLRAEADVDGFQPAQQAWVNSDEAHEGAALSPDGRFIIGYATNIFALYNEDEPLKATGCFSDLLVFDAHSGQIVRRVAAPRAVRPTDTAAFKVWFSDDKKTMLAQGPTWKGVLSVRLRDWKFQGTSNFTTDDLRPKNVSEPHVFSPDGRYFCNEDGADIVVRDASGGQVVKRALKALEFVPADDTYGRLPHELALAPDLSAIYFLPRKNNIVDGRLWRWPLTEEPHKASLRSGPA